MNLKSFLLSAITVGIISGCATAPVERAAEQVKKDEHIADQSFRQGRFMTKTASNVEVLDEYYISAKPFTLTQKDMLPRIFEENLVYSTNNPVSLQEMVTDIGNRLQVRTMLTADAITYLTALEDSVEENKKTKANLQSGDALNSFNVIDKAGQGLVGSKVKFTLDHSGSVTSFLDYVGAKTNLFWKWEDQTIIFYRTETKTLIVDYLGGKSTFNASVNSSSTTGEGEEGIGGSDNTSNNSTTLEYMPDNVWESLESALNTMKSTEGKFSVSHEAGTVTITDTPRIITEMEKYIKKLNEIVSQQISIKTEIFEVQLDENVNKGLDFNAMFSGSSKVAGNFATEFTNSLTPNIGVQVLDGVSNWGGSEAFISAMNSVANVSTVTSATVYTTNGMAAPIQSLDTTGYLKSVSREINETGTRETTNIEQGYAKSGFSLGFLPRVTSKGDVNMVFAGDLTQLTDLKERQFDGTTIEFPESTNKSFLQRFVVKSGKSIMVAGFERTENTERVDSLAGKETWVAGGKKSGGQKRVMTIIVLTPYVMSR
jgi:type IVB pilus formation R64 PilN family outer membrane protein